MQILMFAQTPNVSFKIYWTQGFPKASGPLPVRQETMQRYCSIGKMLCQRKQENKRTSAVSIQHMAKYLQIITLEK